MKNKIIIILAIVMTTAFSSSVFAKENVVKKYVVKKGDVLWKIAKNHGTTWQQLAKFNNLKNPNLIYPGQNIIISKQEVLSNTEKVAAVLKSIETGATEPAGYINPSKYIQHNLSTEDGLAGFGKLLQTIPKGSAKVNTVRVFQDGNYAVAHTEYNFFGPKAGFDIFRFENGKIVEHWDNLQEIAGPNPSGHTMFDGSTVIKDLDKTVKNKAIVKDFVENVLMGKHPEKLTSYFNGDNYIQHNPAISDGLSGLGNSLDAMSKQGITMKYDKIHMVLGQGNFVLVASEGTFKGKHTSYYDLFRVENNKIAEHWDVIETILPTDQWKNQNGKY
ncbi:LysM peptidoglycan-binding domain-containing protein [Clostridium estertheticum]|uniref:LysM peptidoglycan-binding domain-containing protein n=1 Tax=Clostridium estertheticum TaxID=238834 RepID=UPI00209B1359|nr:LysM peptidoglycan-binding domain-containing protein [Clostridium estertheticum]